MVSTESIGSILGLKIAPAVAGFAGGVVSLSFLRALTTGQAILAVFTGAASSAYLTPWGLHYFTLPPQVENGVAFLIGLTAMNLIPGFIRLAEIFRGNPLIFTDKKDGGSTP